MKKFLMTAVITILVLCMFAGCKGKEPEINYETGFADGTFESEESFESWNTGWAPNGTDHLWNSYSHTDDGTGCLQISHYIKTAGSSSWGRKIHIVENAKYKVGVWIKFDKVTSTTENGNGGAYIVIEGSDVSIGECKGKDVEHTEDWKYFEGYFTGAFTGEASFLCRLWGAMGTAYFDDITVELVEKIDPEVSKHYADVKNIKIPKDGFSLIAIGDPQAVVCSDAQKYYDGMDKIVGKKKDWNILYAMDMGDLVDSCVSEQWSVSVKGHEIFDEAGLKYSLCLGNHDYGSTSTGSSLIGLSGSDTGDYRLDKTSVLKYDHTAFEQYYSLDKYVQLYGADNFGTLGDTISNTWHKFTYGGEKYMIIAFEFAPRKEIVDAAKELCDANPDTHVIVTTHAFISPRTCDFSSPQTANLKNVMSSQDMWDRFVRKCPNVFLVCNGHHDCHGNATRIMYDDAGKPVTILCVNPQGTLNGGEMMTAIIHIENGTEISVYSYCPTKDKYYNGCSYKTTVEQGTAGEKGGVLELSNGFSGKLLTNEQLDGTGDAITYTYTSSNEKVATVAEDGTVTCIGEGKAQIVCMIDRHQSAYCINSNGTQIGAQTKVVIDIVVK